MEGDHRWIHQEGEHQELSRTHQLLLELQWYQTLLSFLIFFLKESKKAYRLFFYIVDRCQARRCSDNQQDHRGE